MDADSNKTYYVSPEGAHKAGELYQGCTEFTWTFTHDSYGYTARCDRKDHSDKYDGRCGRDVPDLAGYDTK